MGVCVVVGECLEGKVGPFGREVDDDTPEFVWFCTGV